MQTILPQVGAGRYRHYKGGLYEVLMVAELEADLTPVVIYRAEADGRVWVRPVADFISVVELEGKTVPRFAPC